MTDAPRTYRVTLTPSSAAWEEISSGPGPVEPPKPPTVGQEGPAASMFNQPLPTDVRVNSKSAEIVAGLLTGNDLKPYKAPSIIRGGIAGTRSDIWHPWYYAKPTDPFYKVNLTYSGTKGNIHGMQVQVPADALPAQGDDGHLTVVNQMDGWEYDFYQLGGRGPANRGRTVKQIVEATGALTAEYGCRLRWGSDDIAPIPSTNAANTGLIAGSLQPAELIVGEIPHALSLSSANSTGFVPPASGLGRPGSPTVTWPAMGQCFQMNMTLAEVDALKLPLWERAILRALVIYGAYVTDTGGHPFDIICQSGIEHIVQTGRDPWISAGEQYKVYRDSRGVYFFQWSTSYSWNKLRVVDR